MGGQGGGPSRALATITRNDALWRVPYVPEPSKGNVPEPSEGGPYLATSELSCSGAIAAPPHSAQSSVRVNATLLHPLVTSSVSPRITEPTVRCVIYIYSFPTTTSRTQEGWFSA